MLGPVTVFFSLILLLAFRDYNSILEYCLYFLFFLHDVLISYSIGCLFLYEHMLVFCDMMYYFLRHLLACILRS